MITTGASNLSIWLEDGQVVYPCPCGETHRGDYAFEDYNHHTCLHGGVLWNVEGLGVLCSDCGVVLGELG